MNASLSVHDPRDKRSAPREIFFFLCRADVLRFFFRIYMRMPHTSRVTQAHENV